MKRKVLAAIIIAMGILAGCGGDGGNPSQSLPTLDDDSVSTESSDETDQSSEETPPESEECVGDMKKGGETHTIGERTEVNGQKQSYLTGEWKPTEVVDRRNMAVMIDNIKIALPQYGISQASIIYEAPVEGRITRLMALFEDYDDLDHIGPVRSSRDYYIYEAMAYDSIYCNWGLARPWVEELINSDKIDNISCPLAGINDGAANSFDRLVRSGNIPLEHTGYMFINGYNKDVDSKGYSKTYRSSFVQAFTFAEDGYLATYDSYPDATQVYPGGPSGQTNEGGYGKHNPCFTYNPEDRLYYRTQYRENHIDEMNGEQLAVTNVVFKVCHGEERLPDDPSYDYLKFDHTGSGNAYVFTNGKVIKGTWRRSGDNEPNLFFDESGNEIVLNQGKTWICCIWDSFENCISYE